MVGKEFHLGIALQLACCRVLVHTLCSSILGRFAPGGFCEAIVLLTFQEIFKNSGRDKTKGVSHAFLLTILFP
jgi:hypothetical protein